MKQSVQIYLLLLLTFTAGGAVSYGQQAVAGDPRDGIELLVSEGRQLVFSFSAGNPVYRQKEVEGERFFEITFGGFQQENRVGEPAVPVFTTLIDVTGRDISSIRLSAVTTRRISPSSLGYMGKMMPRQPARTKNQDPQKFPLVIDRQSYSRTGPVRVDTVSIENLGTIRGQQLALLKVYPLFYYPSANYFDLITSMKVEVNFTGNGTKSPVSPGISQFSPKGLIDKGLADYSDADLTPTFSVEPAGLIIVSDTNMKRHLEPLARWKRLKGFEVTELYIGEKGLERTYVSIKDTLADIWSATPPDKQPPLFLLLAGDLNIIPASSGASSLSDMYYAEFDGNGDYLPDMYTGRLPASDTTQMKSMVEKIIEYEKFLFGDTISHFEETMLVAGLDSRNVVFMNGQLNYADQNYLTLANNIKPHLFLHELNDSIRTVRYDSVKTLLNSGVGFVNYTGHGSPTSWLYTGIDYTLPSTLTNRSRYPVIISNACETARFSNANNFGSAFLKQKKKGALAFIGCTVDSYWDEDFWWAVGAGTISENPDYQGTGPGFYDRLFHQNGEKPSGWFTTLGQIIYAGNLAVLSTTSDLKRYYWEYYHLLGDPSIIPYIGKPGEFTPEIPDSIPPGLKTLLFDAVPFAYAAISDFDTLWDASSVSPAGSVVLNLPDIEKDSCLLVITGQNMKPYFKTIHFAVPDTAWLNIIEANPNDSSGDNNGLADFSDTITFDLQLQNAGLTDASGVYMLISTASKHITIISDSVYIGTIGAMTDIQLNNRFKLVVADSIPDLSVAQVILELVYGVNRITLPLDLTLHSPVPVILSSGTDDTASGNGNRLPEPGETFDITIRYMNGGSSPLGGTITLSSSSHWLTINEPTLAGGLISPGDTAMTGFSVTLDPETPDGETILFLAEYTYLDYSTSRELSMVAGGSIEDFESENFKSFPWTNDPVFPWTITSHLPWSNIFAAQSGLSSTDHNRTSSLTIKVNNPEPDTLSFWYRVSSEYWASDPEVYGDHFIFEVDGKIIFKRSGEHAWQEAKYGLSRGVHTVTFRYKKDANTSTGEDKAWIDLVRFPAISFIGSDIRLDSISTPSEPSKDYNQEIITAEVINLGRDTVYLLPLSYSLNGNTPVNEVFNTNLLPGDSISLAFTEPADLESAGEYTIEVYRTTPDSYARNDSARIVVISTGLDDIIPAADGFTIGENPFAGQTTIESNHSFTDVGMHIFGLDGKLVWMQKFPAMLPGERVTINLNDVADGVYLLKVSASGKAYSYKLIKR